MARIYVGTYAKYIVIFMVFMALRPPPAKAQELSFFTCGKYQVSRGDNRYDRDSEFRETDFTVTRPLARDRRKIALKYDARADKLWLNGKRCRHARNVRE
jgi:hypothetical protein